jgi:hypothetical protein
MSSEMNDSSRPPWSRPAIVVAGVLVFVVAAALRVALVNTARFGGDEALFFRLSLDIIEGRSLPLLGTPISEGAARLPGPAFHYLMALPLLVWRSPEAQYLFTEVLGAATVVVLWASLRRPFGERPAVLTALFAACSPWAALMADRTWNPNVLPFFIAVALWCAWRLRANHASRAAVVLWPTMAVMAQIHMSAPVAWVAILVVVGAEALRSGTDRDHRRLHLLGLGLCLLLYVPLAIHEVQTGFGNTRSLLTETIGRRGGQRMPWSFLWSPVYALRFLTLDVTYHELTGYWGGPDEWRCVRALVDGTVPRPFHPLRAVAMASSLLLMVGTLITAVAAAWRGPGSARTVVMAAIAAVVANLVLMGLTAKQVFGHYVFNQYLPMVMLLAVAFARTAANAWPRRLLQALLFITCLGGMEATLSVSRHVDAKIGLAVHRRASAVIQRDADNAGLPQRTPIRLDFVGLRSSLYDWHVFATRALHLPWHFDTHARLRRYALTPVDVKRPPLARGDPIDVGHAWLWRL